MKKRLLAMLLVLTMILGLASCGSKGSKDVSLSAQVEKMSDMKATYMEAVVNIETDMIQKEALGLDISKLSLKLIGQVDKDNEKLAKIDISYKLDKDEFAKLTTMVVDNQVIYINLKELKEAAPALIEKLDLSQYASILQALPSTEYIKIDPASLSQMGVSSEELSAANLSQEDAKKVMVMFTEVAKAVETAVKDVDPVVITGEDSKVVINLTDKNAKAALEALAKTDYSKCFDTIIEQMEGIESFKSTAAEYKGKKTEVLSDIKKTLEEAAKGVADQKDFAFNYSLDLSGSEGKRVADQSFTVNVKDDEGSLKMSLECKVDEGKTDSVQVPTDATDFMELMSSLMGGMGMTN